MTTSGSWPGTGRFDSLAAGGAALAAHLLAHPDAWRPSSGALIVVAAVVPNGVPVGVQVAGALDAALLGIEVERTDDGVQARPCEPATMQLLTAADVVLVVDDAVETGRAAAAVGRAVRAAGASPVVLAVPVCPRESEAPLGRIFDAVVAPVRPLARRSLTWHYPTFVPVPVEQARAAVSAYEQGRTTG